jgi:hypothetical protein
MYLLYGIGAISHQNASDSFLLITFSALMQFIDGTLGNIDTRQFLSRSAVFALDRLLAHATVDST